MVNISQGSDETLVTVASSYKMQKTPWQLKQLPLQAPCSGLKDGPCRALWLSAVLVQLSQPKMRDANCFPLPVSVLLDQGA